MTVRPLEMNESLSDVHPPTVFLILNVTDVVVQSVGVIAIVSVCCLPTACCPARS